MTRTRFLLPAAGLLVLAVVAVVWFMTPRAAPPDRDGFGVHELASGGAIELGIGIADGQLVVVAGDGAVAFDAKTGNATRLEAGAHPALPPVDEAYAVARFGLEFRKTEVVASGRVVAPAKGFVLDAAVASDGDTIALLVTDEEPSSLFGALGGGANTSGRHELIVDAPGRPRRVARLPFDSQLQAWKIHWSPANDVVVLVDALRTRVVFVPLSEMKEKT